MKRLLFTSLLLAAVLSSCRDFVKPENAKTAQVAEYDKVWNEALGPVDPEQTWSVSSTVSVDIKDAGNAKISIYTLGEEKRTLLASSEVTSDCSISFDMPIGLERGVAVCRETPGGVEYRHVSKENLVAGNASVSFAIAGTKAAAEPISATNKAALTKATCVNPKTGKRAEIFGYTNFPAWIWNDMNAAIPEDISAKTTNQITNFELQSNGLFYISTIYGATGNTSAEIGYYYYDKADPENVTMIPLIDALSGDYYYDDIHYTAATALPKVEWLRNDTWQWTPANFYYWDQVDGMKTGNPVKARVGDDQFNTLSVLKNFGNENPDLSTIAQVRGLTFQVDAPVGNMVGFYCKRGSSQINHTTSSMNKNNYSAAAIKVYDGFRFIGLEDGTNTSAKEPDCNDIAFVMVPGNNGTLPGLLLPYIKDIEEDKYYNGDGTKTEDPKYDVATDGPDPVYEELASKKQVWTLAFEDMSNIGDFDFNDVVMVISPDDKKRSADVILCATGGAINANIYYGDTFIGEAHQLLGSVENGKNVLANTYEQKYPVKKIFTFDMHPGHSIEDEARNFRIVAGNNVVTLPEKGEVPKALCVPGFWAWPRESTRISTSYEEFTDWSMNSQNEKYKNWYSKPVHKKVVKF